ncbi:MAG: hypothetical protein IJ647_05665, partial [Prevotella sp.]|nr:hypothetical protein [Prevotella sp.]
MPVTSTPMSDACHHLEGMCSSPKVGTARPNVGTHRPTFGRFKAVVQSTALYCCHLCHPCC